MPTVLVVDDSAVDRRLAGGLLEKDEDLEIEYAVHGADAMAKVERAQPDLVLTDLIMPEMDGLALVAAIRAKYPRVPVILMTSQGSEEIAVEALQQGAASYVPKHVLAQKLLETIHRVLSVSRRERSHARMLGCLTKMECSFVLNNDSTLIEAMVSYLQDCVTQIGLCDETERTRIGVALEEALVNALYHGNLEVSSELRGENDRAYYELITQRCRQVPYRDRRIHMEIKLSREEAIFRISDEGMGFDPSALPDPTDPTSLERASGRGVLLMRAFMDEVIYNDTGNAVTLTKRRDMRASLVPCGDS
jgi:CheY-like chemotaxis protein/anti-sigma regulatory factor (Ser/Thr protein kinase)